MNQPSSKKTAVAFFAILAIGALIYFYTMGNPTDSDTLLSVEGTPESIASEAIGNRVLTLLQEVNSLNIDATVFNNPVYRSLVDYSIEVPPQNVGRPNPFQPFPGQIRLVPASAPTGR
jgi:hypothetical protein